MMVDGGAHQRLGTGPQQQTYWVLAQPGLTVGSCLSKDSHRTLGIMGVTFYREEDSSEGVIFF